MIADCSASPLFSGSAPFIVIVVSESVTDPHSRLLSATAALVDHSAYLTGNHSAFSLNKAAS